MYRDSKRCTAGPCGGLDRDSTSDIRAYSPPAVERIWKNTRVILGLYGNNGKENGK